MGGLAQALKRKLGDGAASGQQKRPSAAASQAVAAPQDPSEALRQQLANGGFAALAASHTSKHTRTALRKQRKAEQLARQAAQEEKRPHWQRQELRRQHDDGHGSSSDSEEADAAGTFGAADADGVEQLQHDEAALQGAAPAAYLRLLGCLSAAGGIYQDVLQRRQREQAGDSDASSEEVEDESMEGQGEEEGEERYDLKLLLGSDKDGLFGSDKAEMAEEAEQTKVAEPEANGQHGDSASESKGGGSGDDDEVAGRQQQAVQQPRRHLGNGSAAAAEASAAAVEDHYLAHFDCELSEERSAELMDEGRRIRYLECAAADGRKGGEQGPALAVDVLQQWPDAELQAAEGTCLPQSAPADLAEYGVKERLATRWREVAVPSSVAVPGTSRNTRPSGSGGGCDFVNAQQRALFALLSCYADLLLSCRHYPTSTDAPDPLLDAVLLHLLSHCAKAADCIKKNNDRLKAGGAGVDGMPKDQGFTRTKVLLLLPQRNLALRVVRRLLELAVRETRSDTIQNKQRFLEEFGDEGEELSEREAAAVARKPADHRALFGGNSDDHFRMGIKLTRGAVKLFSDVFDSDIIVASPLGLATRLAEAEDEGAADFLSSVEVLVAERADVLLMQNWAHVVTVFEALNRIPREGHGVDMMRVRDWALSGRGALYRQTILLSSFASAEMNALLARTCHNHGGKVRLAPSYHGVLSEVIPQARQVFERLPAAAAAATGGGATVSDADARFEHFKCSLWPRIRETGRSGGHLIYLPSYFDYVRVRNFLRGEMASFLGLCEYTKRADAARARAYFFDRRKQVLLYTERAQFYNRHRVRGARDILFYQLPEHAHYYSELLNLLEEGETGETPTVTVVFSKVDALRLERVVGGARCAKMLKNKKTRTFLFC